MAQVVVIFNPNIAEVSGLNYDPDESGIAPTTMDCDNSREDAVCIDYFDDIAIKKIWVGVEDIAGTGGVHVYVYGLASGTPQAEAYHHIFVNTFNQYKISFRPHDCFSTVRFGWHLFWFPKEAFQMDDWNYIKINCSAPNWSEGLFIGIDKTFPTNISLPVKDFQRSAWNNSWNSNPEPFECDGELMIRVFFYRESQGFYQHDYERDDLVAIDYRDDKCEKRIWINYGSLDDVTRAQLYIWGYAWGTANPGHSYCYIKINGNYIYFNAYDVFMENCWGWGIIDFPARDYLIENSWNYFYFGDFSSWAEENFAIGIDTDTNYLDNSRWQYYDGQWHGTFDYSTDQGELMLSLTLFDRGQLDNNADYLKEFSITYIESYDYLEDLTIECAPYIREKLKDQRGWTERKYEHDSSVTEGDFYLETWVDTDLSIKYEADSADFIYHAGHGVQEWVLLKRFNGANNANPDDQFAFTFTRTDPNQPEWNLECDYSSDGLDCDVEWVWYQSCRVLRGHNGPTANDNIFQTLLYHGVHMVLSNYLDITFPGNASKVIKRFYYWTYVVDDPQKKPLLDAWYAAYNDNGIQGGLCYYHSINRYDYFWGVKDGPAPDSYSHSDIAVMTVG